MKDYEHTVLSACGHYEIFLTLKNKELMEPHIYRYVEDFLMEALERNCSKYVPRKRRIVSYNNIPFDEEQIELAITLIEHQIVLCLEEESELVDSLNDFDNSSLKDMRELTNKYYDLLNLFLKERYDV